MDDPEDGSVVDRIAEVVEDLPGVERSVVEDAMELRTGGRLFAVVGRHGIEVELEPLVAGAAARTPDAVRSARGEGWVAFTPARADRFALDRAESWLRSAYRRASGT
jgi:hypothetical protein